MMNTQMGAPIYPTGTPTNNTFTQMSITQATQISQAKETKSTKSKRKSNRRMITNETIVYSLAIKIYDEQLPYGWEDLQQQIRSQDPKEIQIQAIKHYKDYLESDSFWQPSIEKPHYHIILRMVKNNKRIKVSTILNKLNIVFRKGLDDKLLQEHACETVENYAAYSLYLTHETNDAILDGKSLYRIQEVVSNLSISEIEQIRDGYIRPCENRKITQAELISLDAEAYKLGYELKDFDEWYNGLNFVTRSNAKMKVIRESYTRGVESRLIKDNKVNRLCIFISGPPNTGKTYAAKKSITGNMLNVSGGGSGKFDNLKPSHNAIIIDDDICPNLLNMTDNYYCKAYRRNKNNPVWAGDTFIVTSNLSFYDWVQRCGIKVYDLYKNITEEAKAIQSRFFICHLQQWHDGTNRLICDIPSNRGSVDELQNKVDRFGVIQINFNAIIKTYKPKENYIDYRLMNCIMD